MGEGIWSCIRRPVVLVEGEGRLVRSQGYRTLLCQRNMDICSVNYGQDIARKFRTCLMKTLLYSVPDASLEIGKGLLWAEGEDHKRFIHIFIRSRGKN